MSLCACRRVAYLSIDRSIFSTPGISPFSRLPRANPPPPNTTAATTNNDNNDNNRTTLRDFLIQLKQFSGEDNRALFSAEREAAAAAAAAQKHAEQAAVPGVLDPYDKDLDDL